MTQYLLPYNFHPSGHETQAELSFNKADLLTMQGLRHQLPGQPKIHV